MGEFGLESSVHLAWLGCLCGLGLGFLMCDRLALWALSFAHFSLGPLSSSQALSPNTIHPRALASISSLVWPPFRVGFAGKLLPVSGYAWTPRSWETVVVLLLGFGKGFHFEVSGPYRAKLTVGIGYLLLLGILLLCFLASLDGIGS